VSGSLRVLTKAPIGAGDNACRGGSRPVHTVRDVRWNSA
jgi:hypothetical protein